MTLRELAGRLNEMVAEIGDPDRPVIIPSLGDGGWPVTAVQRFDGDQEHGYKPCILIHYQ